MKRPLWIYPVSGRGILAEKQLRCGDRVSQGPSHRNYGWRLRQGLRFLWALGVETAAAAVAITARTDTLLSPCRSAVARAHGSGGEKLGKETRKEKKERERERDDECRWLSLSLAYFRVDHESARTVVSGEMKAPSTFPSLSPTSLSTGEGRERPEYSIRYRQS